MLIATDGKAGHENQSRAFCRALGFGFDLWPVSYPAAWRKAAAYAADRLGVLSGRLFRAAPPPAGDYAAVVCAGSTAFYPGKTAARRLGIPSAAILYPKGFRLDFDCILAPAFDRPPERPNIIPVPVNLTAPDAAFYEEGVRAFRRRHTQKKAAAALIAGGPNAFADMTAARMREMLDAFFAATPGLEHWATTSRRTPPDVEALIASYPFDYALLYSRDRFNPIPAFVSLCERLFVTADSTGMISEAVTVGSARVEILMNLKGGRSKFARFIRGLEAAGAVHLFDGAAGDAAEKIDLAPAFAQARTLLRL